MEKKIIGRFNKYMKGVIDTTTKKPIPYSKDTVFELIFNWMIDKCNKDGIFDFEISLFLQNDYAWITESDLVSDILL